MKSIIPEVLVLVFQYLYPKDLLLCECICKSWQKIITDFDASIWKSLLLDQIQISSNTDRKSIRQWIDSLRVLPMESWKTVFRVRLEWSRLTLNDSTGIRINQRPRLIKANQIRFGAHTATEKVPLVFKVGELEQGIIQVFREQPSAQKICFKDRNREPFAIGLSGRDHFELRVEPLKLSLQPQNVSISFVSNFRTDLQILQESVDGIHGHIIRIWDPVQLNTPYSSPGNELETRMDGLWIIKSNFEFVSFCGRMAVLHRYCEDTQESEIVVLQLQDYQKWATSGTRPSGIITTDNVRCLWSKMIDVAQKPIYKISMNESILSVLQKQGHKLLLSVYRLSNGDLCKEFEPYLPFLQGFETVPFSFVLSRFHLILFNCNFVVVYDLIVVLNSSNAILPTTITKIPYVGRNIKLDISDDASMILITPLIQHGEVVLIDIIKRTCNSYILQNGFIGKLPKKGCWLVFENCKGMPSDTEIKVLWSPIVV